MPPKSIETLPATSALNELEPHYKREERTESHAERKVPTYAPEKENGFFQLQKLTTYSKLTKGEQDQTHKIVEEQYMTDKKRLLVSKGSSEDVKNARERLLKKYAELNYYGTGEGGNLGAEKTLTNEENDCVNSCAVIIATGERVTSKRTDSHIQKVFYTHGWLQEGWTEGDAYKDFKNQHPQIGEHLKAYGFDDAQIEEFYQNQYFLQIAESHKSELNAAGIHDLDALIKDFKDMKLYLGIDFEIEEYIQDLQMRSLDGDRNVDVGLNKLFTNIQNIDPTSATRKGYFDQQIGDTAIEEFDDAIGMRKFVEKIFFTQNKTSLMALLRDMPADKQDVCIAYLMGKTATDISSLGTKHQKELQGLKQKVDHMIDAQIPTMQKELTTITNVTIKKYALIKVMPILNSYLNVTYGDNQENFLKELTIDEKEGVIFNSNQRFAIGCTINGQKIHLSFDTKGNVYVQDAINKKAGVDIITLGTEEEKLIGQFPDMQGFILDAKHTLPFADLLSASGSLGEFTSLLATQLETKTYPKDVLVAQNALQRSINKNMLYHEIQQLTGTANMQLNKTTYPNQYAFYQKMDQGIDKLTIDDMRTLMTELKTFQNNITGWKPREQTQYTDTKNKVLWDLFNNEKMQEDKKQGANDNYPNSRSLFLGQSIFNSVEQGYSEAEQGFDINRLKTINACMQANRDVDEEVGKSTGMHSLRRYRETMKWIEPHYTQKDKDDVEKLEQQFA